MRRLPLRIGCWRGPSAVRPMTSTSGAPTAAGRRLVVYCAHGRYDAGPVDHGAAVRRLAAFRDPGTVSPMLAGTVRGPLATWVTFAVIAIFPLTLSRSPRCWPVRRPGRAESFGTDFVTARGGGGKPGLITQNRRTKMNEGIERREFHSRGPGSSPVSRPRPPLDRAACFCAGASPAGGMPMTYEAKPLSLYQKSIKVISEKVLVSHSENNYVGAVKRLAADKRSARRA